MVFPVSSVFPLHNDRIFDFHEEYHQIIIIFMDELGDARSSILIMLQKVHPFLFFLPPAVYLRILYFTCIAVNSVFKGVFIFFVSATNIRLIRFLRLCLSGINTQFLQLVVTWIQHSAECSRKNCIKLIYHAPTSDVKTTHN